jgi:hypothetical protein
MSVFGAPIAWARGGGAAGIFQHEPEPFNPFEGSSRPQLVDPSGLEIRCGKTVFRRARPLGRGSSCVVFEYVSDDGRSLAVKSFFKSHSAAAELERKFYGRKGISDPSLLRGLFVENFLVMERAPRTLSSMPPLSELQAVRVALALATDARSVWDTRKLIYTDLKPENVGCFKNRVVFLDVASFSKLDAPSPTVSATNRPSGYGQKAVPQLFAYALGRLILNIAEPGEQLRKALFPSQYASSEERVTTARWEEALRRAEEESNSYALDFAKQQAAQDGYVESASPDVSFATYWEQEEDPQFSISARVPLKKLLLFNRQLVDIADPARVFERVSAMLQRWADALSP